MVLLWSRFCPPSSHAFFFRKMGRIRSISAWTAGRNDERLITTMNAHNVTNATASRTSGEYLDEVLMDIRSTRGILVLDSNYCKLALQHSKNMILLHENKDADNGLPSGKLVAWYSELAKALLANESFQRADELFGKTMVVCKQLSGFSRLQLYNPSCGQALIQRESGNHDKAAELFLEAFNDREHAFSSDTRKVDGESLTHVKAAEITLDTIQDWLFTLRAW